jgi:hypothetical protein
MNISINNNSLKLPIDILGNLCYYYINEENMIVNYQWLYNLETKKFIPPTTNYWCYLDTVYLGHYEDLEKYPVLWSRDENIQN